MEKGTGKGCHNFKFGPEPRLFGEALDMSDVARLVFDYTDRARPVVDRTGLKGLFEIDLEVAPLSDRGPSDRSDGIGTILSVIGRLGLKLESQKGPVETLVIDYVERPSEN
jgi:uncharacterized protein (TIGR03435 family)